MARSQVVAWIALLIGSMQVNVGCGQDTGVANEALIQSVLRGKIESVREALNSGAEIDNARTGEGGTALMIAASRGYTEIANLLLEAGADVNLSNRVGGTALHMACGTNALVSDSGADLVKKLLEKGANTSAVTTGKKGSWTALGVMDHTLQELKKPEYMKLLREKYPGVEYAQIEQRHSVLTELLKRGGG